MFGVLIMFSRVVALAWQHAQSARDDVGRGVAAVVECRKRLADCGLERNRTKACLICMSLSFEGRGLCAGAPPKRRLGRVAIKAGVVR